MGLLLACASCASPDPKAELEIQGNETYWVVDAPVGRTQYLPPAVRFLVRNKGKRAWGNIEATATFRRKGEEDKAWGSDYQKVTSGGKELEKGESVLIVMRSDSRYFSDGPPETFFHHELFKDATVEIFLRIGSSNWTPFAKSPIDRRIGTRDLGAATAPQPHP